MTKLKTVDEVIEALGGHDAVMYLTDAKSKSVISNWKTFGRFPPNTYLVMTIELAKRQQHAPASLWAMREPVND